MEDYDAFAAALGSGISELRGCLIASSDGRALGVYPDGGGTDVADAWRRLAELRACDRAVVEFGPETWCLVRRGSHVAFAVMGPSADPRAVGEHMEQVLIAAEKTRAAHGAPQFDLPSPPDSSAAEDDDEEDDDEQEVDRISLVSEFSRLLQDHGDAADGKRT
jgi:hypothetical protein